jgi:hypothetical protein
MTIKGCCDLMDDKGSSSGLDAPKATLLMHGFVTEQTNIDANTCITKVFYAYPGGPRIDIRTCNDNADNTSI